MNLREFLKHLEEAEDIDLDMEVVFNTENYHGMSLLSIYENEGAVNLDIGFS